MQIRDATLSTVREIKQLIIFAMIWMLAALAGPLHAQSVSTQFVPFQNFVISTAAASSADYVSRPDSRVLDAAAFEQMRQHILSMYQGIQVVHSFVEDSQYFDCVPVAQQPTARFLGITDIDSKPPVDPGSSDQEPAAASESRPPDAFDNFGNSVHCETNTIPMARITLDEVTRFRTLNDFFRADGIGEDVEGDGSLPPAADNGHRYARERQTVDNRGGQSALSLWDPPVGDGDKFSLSQHWYAGGEGDDTQTVEGGWIKYPKFPDYFGEHSSLFVFWTANNYGHNGTVPMVGCYNLKCMPGFMQTNDTWKLGGKFDEYSVKGGKQHWFYMEWRLYTGLTKENGWWLRVKKDTSGAEWTWIGYYPIEVFNGGKLATVAQRITYGGETLSKELKDWPVMGSGELPEKGWKWAAYHSNILYRDTDGKLQTPTLPDTRVDNCYKLGTPAVDNAVWGKYFFFGGPGGANCAR